MDDAIINVDETASPRSQRRQDLNSRMRALLEAPPFEPDPNQTALKIDDDDDADEDDDNNNNNDYNYLIEADLYNSAKQDEGDAFLDVLERVSNSKRMSITAIFKSLSLSGDTLLHVAASNGNADIVELIIHHFHSLLSKENHIGDNAVHVAAKAGEASVVQVINSKRNEFSNSRSTIYCGLADRKVGWTDASLKVKNKEGNTPLHEALINRHENLAIELVKEDDSVSAFLNTEYKSAFYLAAEAGYENCLKLMMECGSIRQKRIGKSPVHAAVSGKHTGALDIMLAKQPGLINSRDEEGRTPLHFAAWMGYEDQVGYLIHKNSRNATKRDENGQLPIHLASMNGHIDVIKQLNQQHYNPSELLNGNGQNILHVAAECGKYKVVIYILKQHQELNQLINKKDHDGNTPLHLATMRFHPKIVSALTWDKRVDLNLSNNKNMTALDAAEYYKYGISTFRQQLTWSSLKAAGASHFSSGKIDRNAGMQSKPPNTDNNTNKQLPSSSSVDQKQPSTENFKDRVNTLLLVSILIATITFAAGFTMPGGFNNSKPDMGIATMINHPMFYLFVLCDTIAMFTSLVVAVTLIWAQLGDISLINRALSIAVPLLGVALTMMSLAFMAGIYLVVSNLEWLSTTILVIASLFIIIVLLLFFPLAFPFTSRHHLFRYITHYFICNLTFIVGNS